MTKSSLSQHDSLFKKFLGDIAVAKDFLEVHLPPHLREHCDFSTLAMESGSFIENDLRPRCSDMLYSIKTTAGHDGYVYCLVEHQSRPEKIMAFRLMRYAVAAMQRHIEQGNDTLPVVIPSYFTMALHRSIRIAPNGSIALLILNWQNQSTGKLFRWLILPRYLMRRS